MDSAPQSNRGCRSPDPLHQIWCSVFILEARSWTVKATVGTQRGAGAEDLSTSASETAGRRTWDDGAASENLHW